MVNCLNENPEGELGKRDVSVVATYVLDQIIPRTESKLRRDLRKFRRDLVHQAPEVMANGYHWQRFINILNKHVPQMVDAWHHTLNEYLLYGRS
jgi:hypothetical protein